MAVAMLSSLLGFAQQIDDTGKSNMKGYLSEITILGEGSKRDVQQMPDVSGTTIYAGKKNSIITIDNIQGNVATNTMRQILAKVPGIQIWESDGSGIQVGISARGLSPNRSWEFNVRQNGYDIAADPFGYPEAYYNPQMQAVQRIQMVRGAGSLQYGPQFGGMINYVLRDGSDINKRFQFETKQTIGSYGLFNSFNAIGGNTEKIHYYAFFDHRNADGWRENSRYKTNTGFATVNFKITDRFKLGAELLVYNMVSQQPGGLTDSLFGIDAQKSFRHRNWISTPWVTAALNGNFKVNEKSQVNLKVFGMWGQRDNMGFTSPITVRDSVISKTGEFNNRNLARDYYRNYGLEARYLAEYHLWNMKNTLSVGLRAYHGNTYRLQNGKGTNGIEFNTQLEDSLYPNDLSLSTDNGAVFAENIFRITNNLFIIPGFRIEYISMSAKGRVGFNPDKTPNSIKDENRFRNIILGGIGAEYHTGKYAELYANITQAYRPMLFSDISASPTTDIIDPNMKDAEGYNADMGYRGTIADYLFFDVSGYYLKYNDRIGLVQMKRADSSTYNYRTNVGNSTSTGLEAIVEFNPIKAWIKDKAWGDFSVFVSYSFTEARYDTYIVKTGDFSGNRVENAPRHILRSGLTYNLRAVSLTYQYSYISEAFSDANNTVKPTADGNNGLIPSYAVSDLTASHHFKQFSLKAGVNNLFDVHYFTRRSGGYPGPGLLPAEGRSFFLSIGAKL